MHFKVKPFFNYSLVAFFALSLLACSPNTSDKQGAASTPGASGLASVLGAGSSFKSIDITGAEHAKDFDLPDQNGQKRSIKDFKGKVVVLFFGYTQCPDVCPTAMMDMAAVKKALGPKADQLQVIFVTLDPERDTPDILKAYMGNFDSSFLALIPKPQEVATLAKQFKIVAIKEPGQTAGSYTLNHTASSFMYDTQGRVRLYTRPNGGASKVADLTHDIEILLAEK